MSYNINRLSSFLKEIRELMMYKQTDVSNAVGISVQSYSKYENGTREPSVEVLYRLSEFYKVSPLLFMSEEYPLSVEEYSDKQFMILAVMSSNFEKYKWLLKRYMDKLNDALGNPDFDKGIINKDLKTILKIKASLFRISGNISSIKSDIIEELEKIEFETRELIEKADRLY